MKCYNCNSTNTYIKEYKHSTKVKDEEITFVSPRRFCADCKELVYDPKLDNDASLKAIKLYNEKFGIPAQDIVNLRKNLNLSQDLFAKIIGCAKKTLISYEKGTSIPNQNFYITLKTLINDPKVITNFIEANKEELSKEEYQKINSKIIPFLGKNIKQLLLNESSKLTKFNGYTELNYEKIKNIILYFSEKNILKTKLLKEMFYADFLNYKKTGASITGLEYVKLTFGPVPDDFEVIISYMQEQNLINYTIEFANNSDYEYHKITSLQKSNIESFSNIEKETLKKVKTYFKDYKSKDIVEKSHQEMAFLKTKYNHKIDYTYALDIDI